VKIVKAGKINSRARVFIAVALVLMLAVVVRSVYAGSETETEKASRENKLEAVKVIDVRSTGDQEPPVRTIITVEVTSNGCTTKGDFVVEVVQRSANQEISIIRTRRDTCKRMPFKETLELVTEDVVPGKPWIIKNPIPVR